MIKRIVSYCFVALVAFLISYYANYYILSHNGLELSYSLLTVYLFNAIASVVVYVLLDLVAAELPTQVGFAYLTLVFIKLGLFIIVFSDVIFTEVSLAKFERFSLLVPVFLYLILEAVASFKLLKDEK